MKKMSRTMIIEMYQNPSFNNSSMLLYLFLAREAIENSGEAVIENFSRNSIIEDMKSVMPWIHTGTMYNAFDDLFKMNYLAYGLNSDGSQDENTLYVLNACDGFVQGDKGFLYILDLFFTHHFYKLRLGTKRVLLYILHRIGTSKPMVKISLQQLVDELLGLADLSTKYKILRAIQEIKIKGILSISKLHNNVFNLELTEISKSKPNTDYVVDYSSRHKKKSTLIQSIAEKNGVSIDQRELSYILRATFRCTLAKVEEIILFYIEYIKTHTKNRIKNTYRFIQAMC